MRKVKVGVIGCGLVAQLIHLPYLKELDGFEVEAISDVSPKLLNTIGNLFGVKKRYRDYRQLLKKDMEAVLILTPWPLHSEIVIAAAEAGKHILVEKSMCISLQEADKMIECAEKNNVILMVSYMKRYDPGYLYGQGLIKKMGQINLIKSHCIVGPNDVFLKDVCCKIYRYDDVPPQVSKGTDEKCSFHIKEALGEVPGYIERAYKFLLGSGIHDINMLRGIWGDPQKIISSEIYNNGFSIISIMDYEKFKCVLTLGLTDIKIFDEELSAYGQDKIVKIQFPSPFIKNAPTYVSVLGMEGTVLTDKKVLASYEESFKKELEHFYRCIVNNKKPLTTGEEAKRDIALLIKIIEAYKIGKLEEF